MRFWENSVYPQLFDIIFKQPKIRPALQRLSFTEAEPHSMRTDRYHIEMDNLSRFPIERSTDCENWEDVSQEELDALLDNADENKAKNFLAVVRGGSFSRLEGYFYRIRPRS